MTNCQISHVQPIKKSIPRRIKHLVSTLCTLLLVLPNVVTGVTERCRLYSLDFRTERDMGGDADLILPPRERFRLDAILGPEIVASGPILDEAPPGFP
jgi:hypothetical protein